MLKISLFEFFFPFSALLLPALGPHTLFSTFPNLPAAAKLWPLLVQPCSHSPPQMDFLEEFIHQKKKKIAAHLCLSKLLVSVQPEQWGCGRASKGSSCNLWALVCCPGSQPTGLSWGEISQKSAKKEMYLRYVLLWGLNLPECGSTVWSYMELRWSRVKPNKLLSALLNEFMLQANKLKNPHGLRYSEASS